MNREELENRIRNLVNLSNVLSEDEFNDAIDFTVNKIMSLSGDQWISVEYHLPEQDKQVLIYSKDWGISFAIMQHGRFWDGNCYTDSELVDNVTHWMPLPQTPKESEA
jgi:hypothetical protein